MLHNDKPKLSKKFEVQSDSVNSNFFFFFTKTYFKVYLMSTIHTNASKGVFLFFVFFRNQLFVFKIATL